MISKRQCLAGLSGLAFATSPAHANEISVPIAVARSRRIMTSLTIHDQGPFYFFVDTGAFISGIRPSLARKLGLRRVESMRTSGLGGSDYTHIYEATDVVFGESFRVKAMAMGGLEILESRDYEGLLAAGFLTGVPSQLDFEASRIRFQSGGERFDTTGYHPWPSRREQQGAGEKIYVDVMIDGIKANCLLDTGSPPALILHPQFVRKNKLWDRYAHPREQPIKGIHGDTTKSRYVHADSLDIGGFPIKGAPVTLLDPQANSGFGLDDGIIGMGAIGRFNHIFAKDGLLVKPNRYFDKVEPLFSA
ncbi:aspartyl protease family protein [Asticcacaulis excentricus]|uniref:aspartyl protease family protein n=1 Tax=Asticcacaulis excentricus TaxID=78587 RepID=UPI000F84CE3B|nr:retropepsin-like aspartic protease [Asticcacaulis excentricus]